MAAAEAAARQKMEAEKRAAEGEAKMHEMEAEEVRRQQQAKDEEERRKYAETQAMLAEQAKPKFIAEYKIASGDKTQPDRPELLWARDPRLLDGDLRGQQRRDRR